MLASEVMDQALIFLNDTQQTLYTYAVQVPYLVKASEDLEKELIAHGISVQRVVSSVISVAANSAYLTLPSDFLLPISLKERRVGESDDDWVDLREKPIEPTAEPTSDIGIWAFRDNRVYLMECTVAKEVELEYIRSLTTISSQSSTIDVVLSKGYLAARTGELCARYIGMNSTHANEIYAREVIPALDNIIRAYVLAGQSVNRARRQGFSTGRK